jgi:hypothetical protein
MGTVTGASSTADLIVQGPESYSYGGWVANVGDIDGDGLDDLALGAWSAGGVYSGGEGAVYVLDPGTTTGTVSCTTIAMASMTGEWDGDRFGSAVAGGDFDDDGYSDVFVSATYGGLGGRVYGWLGPVSGAYAATSASVIVDGVEDSFIGYDLAVGDVTGDGPADVAIGAPEMDTWLGNAYVLTGPTTGSMDVAAAASVGSADDATSYSGVGQSVGIIGDWSGDGVDDLLVGGPGVPYDTTPYAGRAWVFRSDDL